MSKFFESLSFRHKIIVGFAMLSSILILGMGSMLLGFTHIASLGTEIIERHQPVTNVASRALKDAQSASNQLHQYLLTDGATSFENYSKTLNNLSQDIQTLSRYAEDAALMIDKQQLERSGVIIEEINKLSAEVALLNKNYEQNHPIITSASTLLNTLALEYLGLINQIIDENVTENFQIEALLFITNMRNSWSQMMSHLRISLATRTTDELVNVRAYLEVNRAQTERFKALNVELDFEEIKNLEKIRDKYLQNLDTVIGEFNSSIWRRDAHIMTTKIMPLYKEIESYLDEITKIQLVNTNAAGRSLTRELSIAHYIFIALIIIGLVFSLLISTFITRSLQRPLKKLVTANKAVAMGNLDTKVDESGNDEIAQLNHSFNDMVNNLNEAQAAIKAALKEAKRASDAKTRFLSSMSHELRNPLNAILGFSQLLELDISKQQSNEQSNIEHVRIVKKIRNSGHHLLELINDVLDLSRIEGGHLNLQLEPVDVHEIVLECISQIEAGLATKKNIMLIDQTIELDVSVLADHMRLRQVLMNLMSNAVKYNRDGGSVTIESSLNDDDMLRISVIDTGYGITEQDSGKLFDPFERLSFSHGNVEGTGVGLTITRQLIEAMGGSIGLNSIVGQGSTFWIELPVCSTDTDTLFIQ